MSASADLQQAIAEHLASSREVEVNGVPTQVPWLRVEVPIVARRTKELAKEIEAAHANRGLCIYAMPPLPTRAMQGVPFVFFEGAEVRVRIIEQPAVNRTGADAYDLIDDVATALQWQEFPAILAHPLQLARKPTEMAEDGRSRIIDVIFEATYQLNPAIPE